MSGQPLHGHRILVVEDEKPDARRFGRLLREAGAEVVGPAESLEVAERLIAEHGLSAAWLDVWIDDNTKEVWPVAKLLASKGVPFLFCTMMPEDVDPDAWPGTPVIRKKIFSERDERAIVAELARLIAGRPFPG